jgi:hypothetical protein
MIQFCPPLRFIKMHAFRLTGYLPGPRHVNESRCGLRVTRDEFFHTKNDTEFAGLALYLSKRQMRAQKGEFAVKHKQFVYSLMALLTCPLFTGQLKAQSNLNPDFRVRLWKNEEWRHELCAPTLL